MSGEDKACREAFEQWFEDEYGPFPIDGETPPNGDPFYYFNDEVDDSWKAFQAAWNRREPEWLPIETAPKDGTEVWAFNGEQQRMKWIVGEGYALWIPAEEVLADIDPEPDQPTHWMPLPAAPQPPSDGGKDGH